MASALPLDFVAAGPPSREQAWVTQEIAKLTPDERVKYDAGGPFRDLVDLALEEEWRNPGGLERAARARELYGDDGERELADLEASRHPFQQRR
jgi:hypothetical protein